jgi:sensor histidine kinase YesM
MISNKPFLTGKLIHLSHHLNSKMKGAVLLLAVILLGIFVSIFVEFDMFTKTAALDRIKSIGNRFNDILIRKEIYLMPDTAYFMKIRPVFYNPQSVDYADSRFPELLDSPSNIMKNIKKGIGLNPDIRSVYAMIDDPNALYVMVNGEMRLKTNLADAHWIKNCFSMNGDCRIEWRNLRLSYTRNVEVISVYRKVVSLDWKNEEKITGYIVVNYDRQNIENQINTVLDYGEAVALYDSMTNQLLYIGDENFEQDINSYLPGWRQKSYLESAVADNKRRGAVYSNSMGKMFYIGQIYDSSLYYILKKEDRRLKEYFSTLGFKILLIFAIGSIILIILYMNNYIQSGKILKNEVDLLYGRAQINSHFLLNAIDFIYWKNVHSHGIDSEETEMLETLCQILKYTLDSSETSATLFEEINYAKLYLRIQQIRKGIQLQTEWNIPGEALEAVAEKLITQPILENSIQHGFFPRGNTEIKIRVSAEIQAGILYLTFEDNGGGMVDSELYRLNREFRGKVLGRNDHIGLKNINRRLKLKYGDEYGLTLSHSDMGGLCVELKLCCNKKSTVNVKND